MVKSGPFTLYNCLRLATLSSGVPERIGKNYSSKWVCQFKLFNPAEVGLDLRVFFTIMRRQGPELKQLENAL